jgi:hypothetical protein
MPSPFLVLCPMGAGCMHKALTLCWCWRRSEGKPVRKSTRRAAALPQQPNQAEQESPAADVDRAERRLSALSLR